MKQIYLTEHFALEEFTRSETAERRHIRNEPNKQIAEKLKALCLNILEPLRQAYGKAIHISSGYRCLELNRAIGSKDTSQHIKGEACDISQGRKSENLKLFRLIQDLGLPFDQLIWEGGGRWIHVSHKANGHNRGQILYLVKE